MEHDGVRIIALAFLVQKLLAKNHFVIWPLMTSGDLNIDLSEKLTKNSFVMIFDELSNAFSRYSLRRLGAELDGGGSLDAPPPRPTTEVSEPWPGAG